MALDKEFLERVYDRQHEMAKDINDIKIVLAKQEENLRHHIYRTDLAEQNIELLRKQLEPVESHVKILQGLLKIFGGLAILAGLTVSVLKIIQHFS